MIRSQDRILTTHAGALPRSPELKGMVFARAAGQAVDRAALEAKLGTEVAGVVDRQIACGIDSVNDGELAKTNFNNYCLERLTGFEQRPFVEGKSPEPLTIASRDMRRFPEYFQLGLSGFARAVRPKTQVFCNAPLKYVGHAELKTDLENFRAALDGKQVAEAFLPANTPGTIEHWMFNDYYKSTEEFVFAIAECMREEYTAIVDAGFTLQIDDPDLPDGWLMYPDMSVGEYRKYATLRVEALNHALRGIPREKIRLHVCWGSFHGPHHDDIPLTDIVDLIFQVNASAYSIEASNPAHEHEWRVFEDVKLPEGAVLIPGVVGHACNFIEHPVLVADRLERYARLVGRENVVAGTDCGLGHRVGHGEIAWAKLEALAEGARIASRRLWGHG
jgi:5-methyltetrahydropteroyltriglutamate--homocysteine methyltransferase